MDKRGFTLLRRAGLLALCVAVNIGGRLLAEGFHLPVWLDMTGTCVAAYFLGLPGGLAAALLNNLFFFAIHVSSALYFITGISCACILYFCIRKGFMEKLHMAMFTSFWIGLASVVFSTPLNLFRSGGYSGNMWGDALFDMLKWYGASDIVAAVAGEIVVEVLDKQLCVLLGFLVIRLLKERCPLNGRRMGKSRAGAVVLALSVLLSAFGEGEEACAAQNAGNRGYSSRIFNNQNGLMSSEANVIAETEDGYLWIGSYAGLTRYDGNEFEFIRDGSISNVTDMLCDSQGRLWIGTNDSGVACYEDGAFTFFKREDGLPADSVRCICEGKDGEIYVATTDRICVFEPDGQLYTVEEDIYYIQSMTMAEDVLYCVGNDGCVYTLRDGRLLASYQHSGKSTYFTCVAQTGLGLIGGTASNELYFLERKEDEVLLQTAVELPIQNIHYLGENQDGWLWICGDDGFGCYVDGSFRKWEVSGFSSSIEYIHEDYQGNIWVASSRHGVLCLSQSPFTNLFLKYDIPSAACNAVLPYRGGYLVGTDKGLIQISRDGSREENELTALLEGDRVRSLMLDTSGNLWVCTYGDRGLVELTAQGEIRSYTSEEYPLIPSDRFRCIAELSNGEIVVGTADGLFFVEDGAVTAALSQEDGLVNSQILSLAEGADGTLYAGSDGAGLFEIREHRICGSLSKQDGLSSDIILRVKPVKYGLLLVTSNSLCLLDGEEIRVLTEFPYYNNFDIQVDQEMACVLSSAGIFTVNLEELCANGDMACSLFNARNGLRSAVTANSWNYIGEDHNLYFCTNNGIIEFSLDKSEELSYRYGLASVLCDGVEASLDGNRVEIPASTREITVCASLRNYALTDVKTCLFAEGLEQEREIVSYSDLEPLRIRNPESGTYVLHYQLYDVSGKKLLSEQVYELEKKAQLWEKGWYQAYLVFMMLEVLCYLVWTLVMVLDDRRRRQVQAEKKAREQKERILAQTVVALAKTVDAKDNYTSGHSTRVAEYARMIAERMGKSEEEQEEIYRAGLLHDVGKIRVPEEVINKPGRLSEEEFTLVKLHPTAGYHILKEISADETLSDGARFHHERYDGKGYPNGLSGEQTPEIARIIGVADAYDAMASNRSYRAALPQAAVREEIERGRGTQFDPAIADIMLQIMAEDPDYRLKEAAAGSKRILVADDEADNLKRVQEALRDMANYEVKGVTSGEQAIRTLRTECFDLLLLDMNMPEMDGFETVERIREFSNIPIVFVASDKNVLNMDVLRQENISDFITKPFKPVILKEILHAVLFE